MYRRLTPPKTCNPLFFPGEKKRTWSISEICCSLWKCLKLWTARRTSWAGIKKNENWITKSEKKKRRISGPSEFYRVDASAKWAIRVLEIHFGRIGKTLETRNNKVKRAEKGEEEKIKQKWKSPAAALGLWAKSITIRKLERDGESGGTVIGENP